MAWQDPSSDIIANLMDYSRTLIARATMGDIVLQAVGFGLGQGGFDVVNFSQALPVDTSSATTELSLKVYPDNTNFSYAPFASTEAPTDTVRIYNCRVEASTLPGNADYALGELAIYAQILNSNVPAEIGTVFLYALSHFPVIAKTRRDVLLRRVIVSY
jgi:hypothetical protein